MAFAEFLQLFRKHSQPGGDNGSEAITYSDYWLSSLLAIVMSHVRSKEKVQIFVRICANISPKVIKNKYKKGEDNIFICLWISWSLKGGCWADSLAWGLSYGLLTSCVSIILLSPLGFSGFRQWACSFLNEHWYVNILFASMGSKYCKP